MSKRDAIQTAINQASLTLNVSEDVAKALKQAELHPAFAQVIMRIHHTQMEMDREIRQMRTDLLSIAQTMSRSADISAAALMGMDAIANRLGVTPAQLFTPEQSDETTA